MTWQPLPTWLAEFPKPYLNDGTARGWRLILDVLVDAKQYPELDTRAAHYATARAIEALLAEASPEVSTETLTLLSRLVDVLEIDTPATEVLKAAIATQAKRPIESQALI